MSIFKEQDELILTFISENTCARLARKSWEEGALREDPALRDIKAGYRPLCRRQCGSGAWLDQQTNGTEEEVQK